jgi:hypothetical protein
MPMKIIRAGLTFAVLALALLATACFSGSNTATSTGTPTPPTPSVATPKPTVLSTSANYSGTADGYFVTLDISVKNDGSEGTVLVQATVTQAGKTTSNEMPVFVKKGATAETKMTFPLVWKGGDATYVIKAVTP